MAAKYKLTITKPIEFSIETVEPTPIPSASATPSGSPSPTASPSGTPSGTPSNSPSSTPSGSPSPTVSPSNTPSASGSPSLPPNGERVPMPDQYGNVHLNKDGAEYVLDRDLENIVVVSGSHIRLRLNGHKITTGYSSVSFYVAWKDRSKWDYGNPPIVEDFALIGPGTCESTESITVSAADNGAALIDGVTMICHAEDMGCVRMTGNFEVRNCTCISHVTTTANRHQAPAVISSSSGPFVVVGSSIIGGQVGINCRTGCRVENNFVSPNGFATNGYGVFCYRCDNVVVQRNVILPMNGRGVMLDGGNNHVVADNDLFARELPNSEFGQYLNPPCVRVRHGARGHVVNGNRGLAIGGSPNTGGSGLYIGNVPGVTNHFVNNTMKAVLSGPYNWRYHYAKAITLEGEGAWNSETWEPLSTHDVFEDNRLESNHICLSCSGPDGYGIGAHVDAPMRRNLFRLESGQILIDEFLAAMDSRVSGMNLSDDATSRYLSVTESIRNTSDVELKPDSWHVWTEEGWRTPVTISLTGSQGDEPLKVRRSPYGSYPIVIDVAE